MLRVAFFSLLALSSIAHSFTLKELSNSDVTHLQMIVNNLNVLMLSQKIAAGEEVTTNEKFTISTKNQLRLEILQPAPVEELTQANCIAIANKEILETKEQEKAITGLILMSSMFELDRSESQKLIRSLSAKVVLVSEVNSELFVECYSNAQ